MQTQRELIVPTDDPSTALSRLSEEIDLLEADESIRFHFNQDPSTLIARLLEEFSQSIQIRARKEGPDSWSADMIKLKEIGCCGCCGGHR